MAICRKTPNTTPRANASPSSKAASPNWRRSSRPAEVIDPSTLSGDHVKFGAHVRLVDEETEKEATYQIVGVHEADIKAGAAVDLLAAGQGADRQEGRRHRLGAGAGRRPLLRDPRHQVPSDVLITFADVTAAAERIAGRVLRTPALPSDAVSRATGADVVLKLDNLQVTGAFKERGAANRLALLTDAERERGVIAMSAGNHAQAVARHAQLLGIAATIVMPKFTPSTKVTRTAAWGAQCRACTARRWPRPPRTRMHWRPSEQLVFVHPYDDLGVIAGQGTLALEMLQDAPDLDALVIPVGGGGLLAGCAGRGDGDEAGHRGLRRRGRGLCRHGAAPGRPRRSRSAAPTIAEGIAVRDIGEMPFDDRPRAGRRSAGGAGTRDRGSDRPAGRRRQDGRRGRRRRRASPRCWPTPSVSAASASASPITGGNIDARILSNVLLRDLLRDGRLLRLHLQIPDRPGVLADIAGKIGDSGGNIIEVSHQRLFAASSVQAAELEVMVEARDPRTPTRSWRRWRRPTSCGGCEVRCSLSPRGGLGTQLHVRYPPVIPRRTRDGNHPKRPDTRREHHRHRPRADSCPTLTSARSCARSAHMACCAFPKQTLDNDQFSAFGSRFGELEINVANAYHEPDHPEMMILSNMKQGGKQIGANDAGQGWHTDMSYSHDIALANILHARHVPHAQRQAARRDAVPQHACRLRRPAGCS